MTEYRASNRVTLKTERLFLRKMGIKDVNEIFQLRSDPVNNAYLDRPLCESMDQAVAFIYKINTNNPYYWAVASGVNNNCWAQFAFMMSRPILPNVRSALRYCLNLRVKDSCGKRSQH